MVLARYKHEVNGSLDFKGTGFEPSDCNVRDRDHDGDDDMAMKDEH